MAMIYKETLVILEEKAFDDTAYEQLLQRLVAIYAENCGISKSFRTIAFKFAVALIENHTDFEYYECIKLFDTLVDKEQKGASMYDVIHLDDEELEEVFLKFIDLYPEALNIAQQ